jgi:photosystem II stability/assembly factor-like uncharacterized protein
MTCDISGDSFGRCAAGRRRGDALVLSAGVASACLSLFAALAVGSGQPRSAPVFEALESRVEMAAPADAKPTEPAPATDSPFTWTKLTTVPYRGKQDDIHFRDPSHGLYVNGAGKIYSTADGGATWTELLSKPGTFWRCVALLDEKTALAGNIAPGYFPNVTDDTPLYRTEDAGKTWNPVPITGDPLKGLCALEVVKVPFINAGNLDHKTLIVGGGRVGGPAVFIKSEDVGKSFVAKDLKDTAAMVLDVHFFDDKHGLIAAATDANVQESKALILRTEDGGATWTRAWEGSRPFELTWKISFPTRQVGYVTIQSYNPDKSASARFVAKTTDGGKTWSEIPLVDDHAVRQFGVAFLDENTGWVGAMPGGFETRDGGQTWTRVQMGNAVNKIRVMKDEAGKPVGYAIGVDVYKLTKAKK